VAIERVRCDRTAAKALGIVLALKLNYKSLLGAVKYYQFNIAHKKLP